MAGRRSEEGGTHMSYDIDFRVKAEGVDAYVSVGDCDANITWNVRKIIELSTGLPWLNEANNGYCKDIIPRIEQGLHELQNHPKRYKPYEAPNGWGTVEGTIRFYENIIKAWRDFKRENEELAEVAVFWIY
jgi:hypothetical protein